MNFVGILHIQLLEACWCQILSISQVERRIQRRRIFNGLVSRRQPRESNLECVYQICVFYTKVLSLSPSTSSLDMQFNDGNINQLNHKMSMSQGFLRLEELKISPHLKIVQDSWNGFLLHWIILWHPCMKCPSPSWHFFSLGKYFRALRQSVTSIILHLRVIVES